MPPRCATTTGLQSERTFMAKSGKSGDKSGRQEARCQVSQEKEQPERLVSASR